MEITMKKRILVVEDDREIRELLKNFLAEKEYIVSEAKNGNEASELMDKEQYILIKELN